MKITHLFLSNFLGASKVDVPMAPITMFYGRNAQGKSSIAEGVRFALTADFGRAETKKAAPSMITEGADNAVCEVTIDDGQPVNVSITKTGKVTDNLKGRPQEHAELLPYVLDGQRIARVNAVERRGMLLKILKVEFKPNEVAKMLVERGLDAARVERVAPLLRQGFEVPQDEAKKKATEAKGAWRSVTGETYGEKKAATWAVPLPAFDAAHLEELQTAIVNTEQQVGEAQRALGALRAQAEAANARAANEQTLREVASRRDARAAAVADLTAQLEAAQREVAEAEAAAGDGKRDGLIHELAELLSVAFFNNPDDSDRASRVMEQYEALHGPIDADGGDAEAAAKLPALRSRAASLEVELGRARSWLRDSEAAAGKLEALAETAAAPVDEATMAEAVERVQSLTALRTTRQTAIDQLTQAKRDLEAAEAKNASAAAHHADVQAWEAIATALSPEGLQAELMLAALQPLNDRLAQSAADTGWPQVVVHGDMTIRCDSRPYSLLSESERWRADAMLAEAVSYKSNVKLLMLDRVDVLDPESRESLLSWLRVLTEDGELHTALLFARSNSLPSALPDGVEAHWVESGRVKTMAEAA